MNRTPQIVSNCLFVLLSMLICHCSTAQTVSFKSLLNEMVDREALARYPAQDYKLAQFSSYDRAMVKPGDSTWFANWDRSMFIREEKNEGRKEYVMFDAKGPGAVVRFWMTFAGENSGKGMLRFYFDGESTPTIVGPAMDVLSGKALIDGILANSVSDSTAYHMRGHNLYLPVPYAKSCKITYESDQILDAGAKTGGESVYYNINYRTYKNAIVHTFSTSAITANADLLEAVQRKLTGKETGIESLKTNAFPVKLLVEPGRSVNVPVKEGSNAIREITLKLSAANFEQALRSTILEIKFDGEKTVWCPVGDFFGTGYQLRPSDTWYSKVDASGILSAFWVMPFKKNAQITLHNLSNAPVSVEGKVITSPWKWDGNSMHFGASWHQFTNLFTGEMKNNEGGGGPFDINYVDLKGKGIYVGDAITLFNTVYAWWGEGDEKIYVDGEKFPSQIGTGTEDYYGYAWCRPEKFINHPFIAQPDGSGNFNPGYTVNMRVRALDAIPFSSDLKLDMEMWHWTRAHINFAPVAFFYMLSGGKSNVLPDVTNAKQAVVIKREDLISPALSKGKVEAENMIFKEASGGKYYYQNSVRRGWSGNMQAFWADAKSGDVLKLSFTSDKAGEFNISAGLTMASGYGKFTVAINGGKETSIIDAYHAALIVKQVDLGKFNIQKGMNSIEIKLTGTSNDKEGKEKALFGLDYILAN